MPRVEFNTFEKAKDWLQDFIIPSDRNYIGYYTQIQELCLIPQKSTRPLVVGYIQSADLNEARKFFAQSSIKVYTVDRFKWDSEREVLRE